MATRPDPFFSRFVPPREQQDINVRQRQSIDVTPGPEERDPVDIFISGARTGGFNLAANLEYFKGIGNSILGNEEALQRNLQEAERLEQSGSLEMADIESFEEFMDNPSFTGFVNQVFSASGQFAPSALGSVITAVSGAGAGAAIAGLTGLTRNLTSSVARREISRIARNKLKGIDITPDEEMLLQGAYDTMRNRVATGARRGLTGGLIAQEYPQGSGIAFGTFADQDMTDPVAAFQSLGLGVPFTAIGVGGEKLVLSGLTNILKNNTVGGPIHSRVLRGLTTGGLRSGTIEGATEGLQEEITIQQRFAIDEDYTQAQAQLDRAQAVFAGFFGGAGMGSAGGAVAGAVSRPTQILDQARSAVQEGYENAAYENFNLERYGGTGEPKTWLKDQIEAMFDSNNSKDSVFLQPASQEQFLELLEENPELASRLSQPDIFRHSANERVSSEGEVKNNGILLTTNQQKAQRFQRVTDDSPFNTQALDNVLIGILGYKHGRLPNSDRVVAVKSGNGNPIWYQETNKEQESAVIAQAKAIFGPNATIAIDDKNNHMAQRSNAIGPTPQPRNLEFDEDLNVIDPEAQQQEAAFTPFEEGISTPASESFGVPQTGTVILQTLASNIRKETEQRTQLLNRAKKTRSPEEVSRLTNKYVEETRASRESLRKLSSILNRPEYKDVRLDPAKVRRLYESLKQGADNATISSIINQGLTLSTVDPTTLGQDVGFEPSNISSPPLTEERIRSVGQLKRGEVGQGWKRGASTNEALQDEASSYFPAFDVYSNKMDSDLRSGFYSDSLLKAYVALSKRFPNNIYAIQETEPGSGTYEIRKLATPDIESEYTLGIPTQVTRAIDIEDARINRGKKATGWSIKTPNSNKFRPVYMPTLTILGRNINTRLQEGTPGATELQSAQEGFNTIYTELLNQGYEITWAGRKTNNVPLERSASTIYTSGGRDFSLRQTQPGRFGTAQAQGPANEQEGYNALKQQLIDRGELTEDQIETKVSEYMADDADLSNLEALEEFIQNEVNPNLDQDQRIILPREFATGEFAGRDFGTGDFTAGVSREADLQAQMQGNLLIETGAIQRKYPKGKAPVNIDNEIGVRLGDKRIVSDMVRAFKSMFKVDRRIQILLADADMDSSLLLDSKVPEQNTALLNYVKAEQQILNDNVAALARVLPLADRDVILLKLPPNPGLVTQGKALLALGHELGHILFNQEIAGLLENKGLYNKLYQEFETARDAPGAPSSYQEEHGFEEWFADQTASFLFNESKRATNQRESYFKRIADKIRAVWKTVNNVIKSRYKLNSSFADYAQNVIQSYKDGTSDPTRRPTPVAGRAYARFMVEDVVAKNHVRIADRKVLDSLKRTVDELLNDPTSRPRILKKIFYTADGFLKSLGKDGKIGEQLAAIFYKPSQAMGQIGLVQSNVNLVNAEVNKLSSILGISDLAQNMTQEQTNILLEAEDNLIPTENLSDKARQVREWLSDFYDRQGLENIGLSKIENYFPRLIAIAELTESSNLQDALVALIQKHNSNTSEREARLAVQSIVADPESGLLEGNETDGEGIFNLGLAKARAKLFRKIPTKELRDTGLLEDPAIATRKYLTNSIRRSEYNKRGGAKLVADLVSQLPENERGHAIDAIDALLGRTTPRLGANFRFINSWALVANLVTMLAFTVFASLPDLAGPILRSKEFNRDTFKGAFSIITSKATREELNQLAKDIGVVSNDAISTMYINAGELDFMSKNAKNISEKFFRYTGLEWFTRFTRVFAAGMGRRFLLEHQAKAEKGNQDSIRYLKELNVTAEQIKAWNKSGQNVEAHPEVKIALATFVDESIVRPNAAERPVWASDPRFALIWQLKSFFYAYGKNIVGGFLRESQTRLDKGKGVGNASAPILLAAATLLPLSMLGLELRERTKEGLAWVLPGISPEDKNYRRSDSMSWGDYSFDIIERSGVFGPAALALPLFMESKRYGNPFWVSPLGPAAERSWDLATGDLNIKDVIPIYSQL